jgi:hypothetical protein
MQHDFYGHDVLHPVGVTTLLICIIVVIFSSRRWALLSVFAMFVLIPSAQRIVIFTLDFNFIRILILIALFKAISKKEFKSISKQSTDTFILLWMICGVIAFGLLYGSFSAVVTRAGYMIEAVGAYYLGRIYIQDKEDLSRYLIILGYLSIPIMVIFLVERSSGMNLFSNLGGVPEYTLIRDGRLRCQGPFPHPIMAGVFWGSILPWFRYLWINNTVGKTKLLLFIVCITIIVINTASSTPVMSIVLGIIGLMIYPYRRHMAAIRRSVYFTLFILHLVMEKPVWHLLARIDLAGGSTGWHRYHLINEFFNHFTEWFLVGTKSTAHWGWGLGDVTNQYVLEAVRGGFLGFILYIFMIVSVFKLIGKALRNSEGEHTWLLWSSGVVLFVHCMNYLAVSYFGQVVSAFFLFLGAMVSISSNYLPANSLNEEPTNLPRVTQPKPATLSRHSD